MELSIGHCVHNPTVLAKWCFVGAIRFSWLACDEAASLAGVFHMTARTVAISARKLCDTGTTGALV